MNRTYGWRSWRDPLREALLGIAIGCAFSLLDSGARNALPSVHTLVRNSILAVSILLLSRGLETMSSWAIEQSRIPLIFRTILYALGTWLGFFLGLVIVASLYGAEETDFRFHSFHFIYAITAAVLISCVVGFLLHHNQKRQDRLAAAQARLKEHEFAEKELEIARAVQRRLLPPPEIDANGFHVSARTEAAHIIGGDFYDVMRLDDGSLAVLVADVSGKGMAASLIMASCKAAVSLLATSSRDAIAVMRALNAKLCDELEKREFVAMVYAHCDSRGRVEIVNAGMPDPLLINNGACQPIVCGGDRLPLGIRRDRGYEKMSVDLRNGARLLLFSDGLPEALVGEEPIGYERVEQFAAGAKSIDELLSSVRAVPGVRIEDDATALFISPAPAQRR
ncbi:MAG TPA: PP2C family protein-serine/threonine phosphatase [Thermoanaerobaculia bacterium]|nr:PP2C family protein-serine/threonine phosphatase [Thermoanaerobaculia bacterium]